MIDRINPLVAKKLIESFIPDEDIRNVLMDFLADSIIYASGLNCSNRNLNLDKTFIRFNVGQEHCIEIRKNESLFICMKKVLERQLKGKELNIVFMG
jgi:hypothetical protein